MNRLVLIDALRYWLKTHEHEAGRAHFAEVVATLKAVEREPSAAAEIGPGAFLRRQCGRFDRLLSLDHRAAREASEEHDAAFHDAVHALRDLRRFADVIAPTWQEAATGAKR